MIKADSFAKQYKKIEVFLIFIFFLVIYFFLFFYKNHFLIGRWEGTVIYDSFMPATELLLPSIQIAGDTVGWHGVGYPMLKVSKYFSSLFGQNTITIKLLANIYGILSLILFFKIIFEAFGVKVAYCSTGLFLSSYYFQIMHGLLISPPLTLLLIFFCIDRFNNFDNKKFGSYFLVALSSALLCMNYIVGRYVLLIIFFCFVLDKNFIIISNSRLIDLKKVKDLFKIILFMILILVIVYPPNIQILFSKNILIPLVADGEHASFELKEIYLSLIGNLIYIYHVLIIGTYSQINIFDLTFGVPFIISPKIFIFFFLIGFFSSFKEKNSFLFYLLFFSILFLNLMSKNHPGRSIELSSAISSFRLYSLIPFYFLFSSLGILFLVNKISINLKINKNYTYFFITLLIIFNTLSFAKERSAFYSYVENISIDFNTSAASKDESIKFQDKLNQIYFFKLSKYIQEKMYSKNKNDSKDEFTFIYLDEDYFTPSYYPPGWGGYPRSDGKLYPKKNTYYFPMFISFYLSHQNTVGYLIRKKDQYFWWRKISTLITNQKKFEDFINTKSNEEIMAIKLLRIVNNVFDGGIFKFINNDLINNENKNSNKYIIYNPNFFKKLSHVVISDKEQLNFVKENFVMDIIHIK